MIAEPTATIEFAAQLIFVAGLAVHTLAHMFRQLKFQLGPTVVRIVNTSIVLGAFGCFATAVFQLIDHDDAVKFWVLMIASLLWPFQRFPSPQVK